MPLDTLGDFENFLIRLQKYPKKVSNDQTFWELVKVDVAFSEPDTDEHGVIPYQVLVDNTEASF